MIWLAAQYLRLAKRALTRGLPTRGSTAAEGREVILFNGRGIASSSGTPRNRIEGLADDIAAVIQALGLPQVYLLGFSIGGVQVQEIALRHQFQYPDRFLKHAIQFLEE